MKNGLRENEKNKKLNKNFNKNKEKNLTSRNKPENNILKTYKFEKGQKKEPEEKDKDILTNPLSKFQ